MRLDSIKLRNIGPFADLTIDLAALGDAQLVAVCGANGAGKTTLLETALPGAMYRTTPTRGALTALATARDSTVEVGLSNGKSWRVRHMLDAVSGKSEAVVIGDDGKPAFESTKVREFDRWASAHLPAQEVLFASVFAPQGAAGFLGAKPAERKAVLLRVLGVERLEQLAESARESAKEARARVASLTDRIGDERARSGDAAACEEALHAATAGALQSETALIAARRDLADGEARARAVEEQRRILEEREVQRAQLKRRLADAGAEATALAERMENNRRVLSDADAIRRAVARDEELEKLLAKASAKREAAAKAERAAALEVQRIDGEERRVRAAERAAQARVESAHARLARRAEVEAASAKLPEHAELVSRAEAEVTRCEQELEHLQELVAGGAEARVRGLRAGMEAVLEEPVRAVELAGDALTDDDERAQLAEDAPEELAAARLSLHVSREELAARRREHQRLEVAAAGAPDLEVAARELQEAEGEVQRARVEASAARDAYLVAGGGHERAKAALRRAVADVEAYQAERSALSRTVTLAGPLAGAEARLAELEPQLEAAKREVERLGADIDALPEGRDLPDQRAAQAAVKAAEASRVAVERELQGHRDAAAGARARLELAVSGSARLEELEASRAAADAEVADWTRLAADLGRDGVQALLIDAAGPEITAIANDLLHTAFGPRFSVRLDTQRLGADKQLRESFDVAVIDTEKGREAPAETYSGGERVILGEALSLALTAVACRRAGVERPDLVRDEAGAALDAGRARAWVAMLRRCAQIIGAHRVYLVSHSLEVQELCDARIDVSRGGAIS